MCIMVVDILYLNEAERADNDTYDDFKFKKSSVSMVYTKILKRCEG